MAEERNMRLRLTSPWEGQTTIYDLSDNIIVDILTRVAKSGVRNLFNTRMAASWLNRAAHNDRVYHNVWVLFFWYPSEGVLHFFQRVRSCDNPEIFFCDGVVAVLTGGENGRAIAEALFKRAANIGHIASKYVLGLLMALREDESGMGEGTEMLLELWEKKCLLGCRLKFKVATYVVSRFRQPSRLGLKLSKICTSKETCKGWKVLPERRVLKDEDDENYTNEVCPK